MTIPVIDVADFIEGRSDGVPLAREIDETARTVGFYQIVGHGVPRSLIDAVHDARASLSALPEERKAQLMGPTGHPFRGLHLNRDDAGVVRQERFMCSRFDSPADAVAVGYDREIAEYVDHNTWPAELPGLRSAVDAYFTRTRELGRRLMGLFAIAAGMGRDGFAACDPMNASSFAINYYPPRREPLTHTPTVLFRAHADVGTLTLVHQRGDYQGLQVHHPDQPGTWIDVPVIDDAYVINVGQMMTHWTNGAWPATRHRVVASENPDHSRTTLTTFYLPSLDTVLDPLPAFRRGDGSDNEPISVYRFQRQRIADGYAARADSDVQVHPDVRAFAERIAAGGA